MKKIIICLCMSALAGTSYGKTVDVNTAQTVAYNFLKPKAALQASSDLSLAYTATSQINGAEVADLYVFNLVSGKGFVIVSGDDNVMPVLGYSTESNFVTTNIIPSVQYWIDNYKNQVAYVIQNNINAADNIAASWTNLKSSSPLTRAARTTATAVTPFLPTLWDQENSGGSTVTYNADCPYDVSAGGQTITGCVATAMSQVMKYWNWPDTGVGSNTYTQSPNSDGIPSQTANFAIAFHFDSMATPQVLKPNSYVAKLMYFAGVSVNMTYGTDAEGGSGSYVTKAYSPITNCAEYALNTYFRYPWAKGYARKHITETNWVDTMLNEMNSKRPVIYAGQGSQGGHCWVMDGYDADTFFHFNWGWSGYSDGYFTVNNLAPNSTDTFNGSQEAIVRIIPDTPANYSKDTATVDTAKTKTGVTQLSATENSINIFPNPAANSINISLSGVAVKEIIVTDIEGRKIQELTPANTTDVITMSVSDLPDGMYLLRIQTDQGMLTRKFVVAK